MTAPSAAERRLALMALTGCALLLGLAPNLVRLADVGPAAAGFWRMFLAAPILALIVLRPGRARAALKPPGRFALLAGLFIGCDLVFWHYGIQMTSVANATTLCNLTPVVVTAFAWIVLGERPGRLFLAALALAVIGAWTMAAGADGGQGTNPLLGDLFSLSVAGWYAGYFLAVQRARRTMGALPVMLWSTLAAVPIALIAALAMGEPLLPASSGGWWALAGLALMHVTGQGGVAWALGRLPASTTAVIVLIQPVSAAVIAWLWLGETVTPLQVLGGAVILCAVLLAQRAATGPGGANEKGATA
ncbi:DMT family transporter [Brevundimonas sp. 2R-24]|uniref:DMT family transporter n=1 Tax=Peiella sedimenti TaxID=3061083 RepID=A0ABT8SM40_9CAUL|nr:DMT family transporter [Caulobacteraceae bacterium XZ-24]